MKDTKTLKATYESKKARYEELMVALDYAMAATEAIKELHAEAFEEMQEAGQELLEALKA